MNDLPKSWLLNGVRYHLVCEHKDGDEHVVVHKHWLKSKQRWEYGADEKWSLGYALSLLY